MRYKLKGIATIIIVLSIFIGCGFQKVQYTNRTQLITMNQATEMKLGLSASQKIKNDNRKVLNKNKQFTKRVKQIGQKLAKVANKRNFKWEFHTISKNSLNAFCLPGGKIFVYTGIQKAAKNNHQLATVIAHEIAHAIARHGAERASMHQLAGISGQLLAVVINSQAPKYNQAFAAAYGFGTTYGVMMPYSRKHEMEADYIGLVLMKKAGYDTKEALKFWNNMTQLNKKSKNSNDYFSTHPNSQKRMEQIKQFNISNR